MNVERMRRYRERNVPATISQPRDEAQFGENPYLNRWAQEMGRRFGAWTVTMHDHDNPASTHVTFTASAEVSS